mmetsp:Transcript_63845/g.171046  ORF Transcript_63845/g.171046 Transcript_63845/m.171046 type:complete len:318 (-) Transcript_63845:30-983(-)
MGFGQIVIGAPGSGKSTYCNGIHQFLNSLGRETVVVNLDPGNDKLPYSCAVDVMELISLEAVMDEHKLGPNGGLIYCMEYLEQNADWLREKLQEKCQGKYVLFDCPGQIELFTHHHSMRQLCEKIQDEWDYRLCCVHLVDSHQCTDAYKFIAATLVTLSTMTMLELPHVNFLSKIDLVGSMGRLDLNLDFYTRIPCLARLPAAAAADPSREKLNEALAELVDSYSLVHMLPLSVQDKETVAFATKMADKSNGFIFSGLPGQVPPVTLEAGGRELDETDMLDLVEERYLNHPDDPYSDEYYRSDDDDDDDDDGDDDDG